MSTNGASPPTEHQPSYFASSPFAYPPTIPPYNFSAVPVHSLMYPNCTGKLYRNDNEAAPSWPLAPHYPTTPRSQCTENSSNVASPLQPTSYAVAATEHQMAPYFPTYPLQPIHSFMDLTAAAAAAAAAGGAAGAGTSGQGTPSAVAGHPQLTAVQVPVPVPVPTQRVLSQLTITVKQSVANPANVWYTLRAERYDKQLLPEYMTRLPKGRGLSLSNSPSKPHIFVELDYDDVSRHRNDLINKYIAEMTSRPKAMEPIDERMVMPSIGQIHADGAGPDGVGADDDGDGAAAQSPSAQNTVSPQTEVIESNGSNATLCLAKMLRLRVNSKWMI